MKDPELCCECQKALPKWPWKRCLDCLAEFVFAPLAGAECDCPPGECACAMQVLE